MFASKNLNMLECRGKCEKEGKRSGACFVVKAYVIIDKVCLDCSLVISIINHYYYIITKFTMPNSNTPFLVYHYQRYNDTGVSG